MSEEQEYQDYLDYQEYEKYVASTSAAQQLPLISPQQEQGQLRGAAVSAANSALFGFGDEIAAGVRSVLPGYQGYDAELAAIRGGQKEFTKEYPKTDIAAQIGGAIAMPIGGLSSRAATLPGKMALGAAEGVAQGAAYGFGQGEGGLENRAKNAGVSALAAGLLSPVAIGATGLVAKGLSNTSDEFLKASMNVQRSELKAARKFAPKDAPNPLIEGLKQARDKGIIKAGDDPASMIAKNNEAVEALGSQVSAVLKQADAAQKNVVIPPFQKARDFIALRPYEADQLKQQLSRRLSVINKNWNGSVSGANELKQQLYKIAYKGNTDSADLDKALAEDLRAFVEQQADALLPTQFSGAVKALNQEQAGHLKIREQLNKVKDLDEMPGGLAKALRRAVVSPIGGGALGVGLTGMGVISPAVGATAALGAAAASRPGQLFLSGSTGAAARAVDRAVSAVPAGFAATRTTSPESGPRQQPAAQTLAAAIGGQQGQLQQTYSGREPSELSARNPSSPQSTAAEAGKSNSFDTILDAIKKVESNGNPRAVSSKGAVGAYQIMPANFKALGVTDPFNEEQSRAGAGRLLKEEMTRFKNLRLALAAYNGGSPHVRDAIQKAGSEDYDKVSKYLHKETREYVEKVLDNATG